MGYYISIPQSSFRIRTADLPKIYDLVAHLMSDEMIEKHSHGGSYFAKEKTASWYAWVDTEAVRKAVADKDIEAIFRLWGYELTRLNEKDGETIFALDIRMGNAKIGDEEKFFSAIAPVMVHGSFLDVHGEDGQKWRWLFENGKFYAQDILRTEYYFDEPTEIAL